MLLEEINTGYSNLLGEVNEFNIHITKKGFFYTDFIYRKKLKDYKKKLDELQRKILHFDSELMNQITVPNNIIDANKLNSQLQILSVTRKLLVDSASNLEKHVMQLENAININTNIVLGIISIIIAVVGIS
jgi:hypothetical protein